MAVAEYIIVRGTLQADDPYPLGAVEFAQIASDFRVAPAERLRLLTDDQGWELIRSDGLVMSEIISQPEIRPERLTVRAPEGGDLKATFELAQRIAEALGANAFNPVTGDEIAHHFPGQTALEAAQAEQAAKAASRKGCAMGLFSFLLMR